MSATHNTRIDCRAGCGACCTAISISSAIPGMPDGKPAGIRCIQLSQEGLCLLFGDPSRPKVCGDFQADREICGDSTEEAFRLIEMWEEATR